VLAAAIAVPVAAAVLLGGLAAWCCVRRRRNKRREAAAARAPLGKDLESGRHHSTDLGGFRDQQHPSDDDRDTVSSLLMSSLQQHLA
jgi:ABC-type nickel/cobalt efflux system permease component RcnA